MVQAFVAYEQQVTKGEESHLLLDPFSADDIDVLTNRYPQGQFHCFSESCNTGVEKVRPMCSSLPTRDVV